MKPGDVPVPTTSSGIRDGLSTTEAAARLERDGPNALPVTPPPPAWRLLAGQMVHFFALLLWGAGILAFVARMPELGVAIFAVVVINGLFAFAQEHRADRAAERLRDLLPCRATVMRDGKSVEIDASELVVGDVVLLSSGDRISADLRVVEAHTLSIDTSTLTGESVPVTLESGEEAFAGTFVVEGEGHAVVTTTGSPVSRSLPEQVPVPVPHSPKSSSGWCELSPLSPLASAACSSSSPCSLVCPPAMGSSSLSV